MLTGSAKAFAILILSCTSTCKILNFLQIKEGIVFYTAHYFLNCTTIKHWNIMLMITWYEAQTLIAQHIAFSKIANNWLYGADVSSDILGPHFLLEKVENYSFQVTVWLLQS